MRAAKQELLMEIEFNCAAAEFQHMKAKAWASKGDPVWVKFHQQLAREKELRALRLLVDDSIKISDLIINSNIS